LLYIGDTQSSLLRLQAMLFLRRTIEDRHAVFFENQFLFSIAASMVKKSVKQKLKKQSLKISIEK
jgi:hypothetical protein